MPLEPYSVIFPEKEEPIMALQLDRKSGKIPKGTYGFIELYCTDKGCDCRRVSLFVLNRNMEEKAVINMGFDPGDVMAGPFLDDLYEQSPMAEQLLDVFVQLVNNQTEFVENMHRHYRDVRTKVEGKKYRGKAFPKPGTFLRRATEPPDMGSELSDLLKAAAKSSPIKSSPNKSSKGKSVPTESIRLFADRYYATRKQTGIGSHHDLEDGLRRYILDHDTFALEISALLIELCKKTPDDGDRIDAALRLLLGILEILRVELERGRPGSAERMERLQNTLAQKIYVECGDTNLCTATTHILLQSRVVLLPVLHDANSQKLFMDAHSDGPIDLKPQEIMDGLVKSIEDMNFNSPFEVIENMLQMLALGNPEMPIRLCAGMLQANSTLVRDAAALMILHPMPEVRLGVSRVLALDSAGISPEALRRLIITRNWFQEDIRKNIDQAITSARRARVECATMPKSPAATVYASPVDGAFAQAFQTIVPDGKGYISCAVMLKKGTGVADAFVIELPSKKELNNFLAMMKQEGAFMESSPEYLDQRVCNGLAEGAELGNAPNFWLAHVAEILGKDQWKAIPLEAPGELVQMRDELERNAPELLADKSRVKVLQESGEWCNEYDFAGSWYEDDAEVDKIIEKALKKSGRNNPDKWAAVDAILDNILEKRRHIWLERLTLTALWLKSSGKAPLPWHKMFHLAESVADKRNELADIPLMESVAIHSLSAYLSRKADEGR